MSLIENTCVVILKYLNTYKFGGVFSVIVHRSPPRLECAVVVPVGIFTSSSIPEPHMTRTRVASSPCTCSVDLQAKLATSL
jgi:hypothetical protein